MWKLKIAEGNDPYLFSTNNFVGCQFWEFDPNAGTPEDLEEVENARQYFLNRQKEGFQPSSDLLMQIQMIKENGIDLTSIPPARLGENEKVNHEALTTTMKKAIHFLRAIQSKDGHWPSDYDGPMFHTPTLLIAMYISGAINTHFNNEHKKEMKRYIYNHQNKDGGWGFHTAGHSTMFGSTLNYVALRLLEEQDDGNGGLSRGRKWILDHGGATSIPSWGKLFLSVLGVFEWEGCNPLPPEFWLFPETFPFHPAKMWSYCRTAYMPMSYLYGKKFQGPITDLVLQLRQEIYLIPYDEINWNKQRHNCCKEDLINPHSTVQDLLWDGLHYFSEPVLKYWPFSKLRERALKRTIELIRYSAEESRYMNDGAVEKCLQMIVWWAEDPSGDEFKHHLARVPDQLWLAEDGMKMCPFGSQLWNCTFATQAIISTNMVEEFGDSLKKASFFLKESQIKNNPAGDFTKMCRQATKGAWTFTHQDDGWAVSDCTAEALKCLLSLSQMPVEISGERIDDERLYEAVDFLLNLQSPISGGFGIWEQPVPQPYLEMLNPSEMFADIVVEKARIENTGAIMQALVAFKQLHPKYREQEITNSVAKAVDFLEKSQWPNGSWYGFWGICFLYGTCFALGGLEAGGRTYYNSEAVRKGVKFLLSTQNEEGGWGESYKSCSSEVYIPLSGNRTNLVQTSWAMLGLMSAGQVERDSTPLNKAAKLLINAQMDNGDFPQQELNAAALKNLMLHSPIYRNFFPLLALGEYQRRLCAK